MKSLAIAACLLAGGLVSASESEAGGGNLDLVSVMFDKTDARAEARPGKDGTATASDAAPLSEAVEPRSSGRRKAGKALGFEGGKREQVADLIARHAAAAGVPANLADAVIRIESRYNPRARNGGAVGLMQIKPQTARGLGYAGGAEGLMNPETNLRYGMRYLAAAYKLSGGDTCATVMRYQSGHYARRANAANRAYCAKARVIMTSSR